MSKNILIRLIAIINLSVIGALFIDFFFMPSDIISDRYRNIYEVTSRTTITRSYKTPLLAGESGDKYQLPQYPEYRIDENSIIQVERSRLFRLDKTLTYISEGRNHTMVIGYLNGTPVTTAIFAGLALYSLLKLITGYESPAPAYLLLGTTAAILIFLGTMMW